MTSHVHISRFPTSGLQGNYVALPSPYPSPAWEREQEVKMILQTVMDNLETLDRYTSFTSQLKDRQVLIKPNLVTVYNRVGLPRDMYPNTTDPRILEGLIRFLKSFTSRIAIVESSGRGMPTRGSFRLANLYSMARYHNIKLYCLEEEPVDGYHVPAARVMKEIYLPRVLKPVVTGEAFFISVPKMKTNLYTGVTLGFKNNMGCIPYNLRQKDHNANLPHKILDILLLLNPHLTLIDGLVGGQGQCPGPVDPVDSRILISGNHCVETDRVGCKVMGFDPQDLPLFTLAQERNLHDPTVKITGPLPTLPFRPADPSLQDEAFQKLFPGVQVFLGHEQGPWPQPPTPLSRIEREQMENVCRGGCLATTRLGFEFWYHEGLPRDLQLTVLLGTGKKYRDQRYYFDAQGQPHEKSRLFNLSSPLLLIGSCSSSDPLPKTYSSIDGCMVYPNSVHARLHTIWGHPCRLTRFLAPRSRLLFRSALSLYLRRRHQIKKGRHLDIPLSQPTARKSGNSQSIESLILPPMDRKERKKLLQKEFQEFVNLIKS